MGRFGNQLFQYAFARAYCSQHGYELRCDEWDGEKIFDLGECHRIRESFPDRYSELDAPLDSPRGDIELHGYFQHQRALIYTRSQAKEWFKWRPETHFPSLPHPLLAAHHRVGDYLGYGYPVISEKSIRRAMDHILVNDIMWIEEEHPHNSPMAALPWLGDFIAMVKALVLFRANSSFSWWAATLSPHQLTFSPIIDGLEGGKEHHNIPFVLGNHPRLSSHHFTTDLHLAP